MNFRALIRLPLRLIPRTKVMRILSGELRGSRWIAGAATHGCWIGTYEPLTRRLFREHVKPGQVVFDVGANAGFYTLLASKLVRPTGRVIAFEPLPRNLRYLREHIRINGCENVTVMPVAVTAAAGSAHFVDESRPSMGSVSDDGKLEVATASLDSLLAAGLVPRPDFIKMDIEGGEDEALAGAREVLKIPGLTIVLSTHGYAHHESCWSLLEKAGFTLRLVRDGAADGDYLILGQQRAR